MGPDAVPPYPGRLSHEVDLGAIQQVDHCSSTLACDVLLLAGGSRMAGLEVATGDLLFQTELQAAVSDVSDTDAAGRLCVLAGEELLTVDPRTGDVEASVEVGPGLGYVAVWRAGETAWLMGEGGLAVTVDLSTGEASVHPELLPLSCTGLAAAEDGSALYCPDPSAGALLRLDPSTFRVTGRCDVYGSVVSMSPGPEGTVCITVSGSNELWYVSGGEMSVSRMVTFPTEPLAAVSTPDGSHAFGSVAGEGLMVVAESGQVELKTDEYGLPDALHVTGDGDHAVVCSGGSAYVLVR